MSGTRPAAQSLSKPSLSISASTARFHTARFNSARNIGRRGEKEIIDMDDNW